MKHISLMKNKQLRYWRWLLHSIAGNYQGLENLRLVKVLRELVQQWDPNIVFLSETKLNKKGMKKVKEKAGFIDGLIIPKLD